MAESPDTINKRKIDARLAKDTANPKRNKTAQPKMKSTSQSKKTDPKIMQSKNNSFSHGFN